MIRVLNYVPGGSRMGRRGPDTGGGEVLTSECCFPMPTGNDFLLEDNSCNFKVYPWGQ